jgi:hypothetical protein
VSYKLQTSFAAGEISPLMYLRAEKEYAALHDEGLSLLKNMIPNPHGPAESRKGSAFLVDMVGETYCRLFSLNVSFAEAYTVAITSNFIYILNRNGFQNSATHVLNGDFVSGGANWTSHNVTFADGTALLTPGTTGDKSAWLYQAVTIPDVGVEHTLDIRCVGLNLSESFEIRVGTTLHGTEIYSGLASGPATSIDMTPTATPIYIEIYIPDTSLSKEVDIVLFNDAGTGAPLTFVSPWTDEQIKELQMAVEPGSPTMLFFQHDVTPRELIFTSAYVWTFQDITFTHGAGPVPWGIKYPGSVTFHDGRMAIGGTEDQPLSIWLSKPREYRDFDLGTAAADDAMFLPLDKYGAIKWLESNTYLFAGLDTGEHILFGSSGPLTSSNAQTEQQSTYGSTSVQSIVLDEDVVYVGTRGRKVRKMSYVDAQESMASFDLSFISEHITAGRILEMNSGVYPYSIIFFTMADGNMITCNIEKDRGTYGWAKHDISGDIISACVSREFGLDIPVLAVIRNGSLYIEHMSFNVPVYIDSSLQFSDPVATDTWFGFDHLIGETVQIVADDAVHQNKVVQPDGSIILNKAANKIAAGLAFLPEMETLPEFDNIEEGNTRSHIKRFSKVNVSIVDCPRPIVNGQDTYKRSPGTPMGEREDDRTEIVEITNTGWSNDAIINVSQPLPLNLVVAAIGGKLKSNKL